MSAIARLIRSTSRASTIADVDILGAEKRFNASLPSGAEINAGPSLRIVGAATVAIVPIDSAGYPDASSYRCRLAPIS